MINIPLNEVILWGLCCLPGGVIVFILLAVIFASMEIGAAAIGLCGMIACWVAGVVMILIGIGMEIH